MVLIQEDADAAGDEIVLRADRDRDSNIRPAGGDFAAGARLAAPRRLRPVDLALLAAMNAGRVAVTRRPVVALIPTGDELVMPGEEPGARPDRLLERDRAQGAARSRRAPRRGSCPSPATRPRASPPASR